MRRAREAPRVSLVLIKRGKGKGQQISQTVAVIEGEWDKTVSLRLDPGQACSAVTLECPPEVDRAAIFEEGKAAGRQEFLKELVALTDEPLSTLRKTLKAAHDAGVDEERERRWEDYD